MTLAQLLALAGEELRLNQSSQSAKPSQAPRKWGSAADLKLLEHQSG